MRSFPELGQRVKVTNAWMERTMYGVCSEHLSTQWVFTEDEGWMHVLPPSWIWEVTDANEDGQPDRA